MIDFYSIVHQIISDLIVQKKKKRKKSSQKVLAFNHCPAHVYIESLSQAGIEVQVPLPSASTTLHRIPRLLQVIHPTRLLGRVCLCSSSRTEVLNLSLWTPRGFPEPPETECKVYMCTHAYEMLIRAEASNFHSIPNGTCDSLHPQPIFIILKLLNFETMDIWGWNSSLFFFAR